MVGGNVGQSYMQAGNASAQGVIGAGNAAASGYINQANQMSNMMGQGMQAYGMGMFNRPRSAAGTMPPPGSAGIPVSPYAGIA